MDIQASVDKSTLTITKSFSGKALIDGKEYKIYVSVGPDENGEITALAGLGGEYYQDLTDDDPRWEELDRLESALQQWADANAKEIWS